jgi:hypothetical protein
MNLETWRSLFRISANANTYLTIGIGMFCLWLVFKLNPHYRLICYYFICAIIMESIGKYLSLTDAPSTYYRYINHPYIIIETLLIGTFFYRFVKSKSSKLFIIFCIFIVLSYEGFVLLSEGFEAETRYGSAVLSGSLCLAGLVTLYELSILKVMSSFKKRADIQIVGSFVVIYALLVFIFFIIPSLIAYSRIMANQVLILKNILSTVSLLFILRGLWIQYKFSTPTASPKPSQRPQGLN